MKAITLHGGPIKGGNSDTLVEHLPEELQAEEDQSACADRSHWH